MNVLSLTTYVSLDHLFFGVFSCALFSFIVSLFKDEVSCLLLYSIYFILLFNFLCLYQ